GSGVGFADVSLKKIASTPREIPFNDWLDDEVTENVTTHIEVADGVLREDLRLASPLPTALRLDENGITAYTSDPNKYARMDHRGLYIRGGAIQIDGGLPDDQIGSASKWNRQGTYIDNNGIYTGSITANQVQVGFNNISNYIKMTAWGIETYSGLDVTSRIDQDGHRFYRDEKSVGIIGTSNWVNDISYRGLFFGLENDADYMTWGFKKTANATNYSALFSWHRTGGKERKGFSFGDDVNFLYDVNLLSGINIGSNNSGIVPYTNAISWVYSKNIEITQYDSGQVQFNMGSTTARHAFFPDGTKKGGSIEIENEVYGMSPVDSPQLMIEYIEFDIELSQNGVKVYLDETYTKSVSSFA